MTASERRITTPVIVLVGPTAIGKTALSLRLAEQFGCEIISMDSMQVYRRMDIGTAKVTPEEQAQVAHHLIDIRDPDEQYDAASFVRDCLDSIEAIAGRGRIPLITGGTGLYLSSLIHGLFTEIQVDESVREQVKQRLHQQGRAALYAELMEVDPASAQRIHPNDTQRLIRGLEIYQASGIPWSEHLRRQRQGAKDYSFDQLLLVGLTTEREKLYQRIGLRTEIMMESGLIEEVRGLLAMGYHGGLSSMQAIGYRHAVGYIQGLYNREQAVETLIRDTRRYAKRQMTWFKQYEQMRWYRVDSPDEVVRELSSALETAAGKQDND
ncbi:tRNA (adenosine(37)-N6)-dimethylallyltransferase MiaA [Desulfogranum mediterraneum]|uniref:tRNA (adenosine(37)-N6)-dimethylallyltransferase MiaA n=1 Tax=Desulfogranum mediterraneum TaxID=160661 RepID=UPI0004068804|nr:tRNA (adenosine(37)-N6)-dimethylallyltransferase MiaA [Desulfogranum mediterraneum]